MPFEIHPVMEHADDQHPFRICCVEHHMRLLPYATKSRRQLIRAAAKHGVIQQRGKASYKLVAIFARLFRTELTGRVARYLHQIGVGRAADAQLSHSCSELAARHRPKCRRATFR